MQIPQSSSFGIVFPSSRKIGYLDSILSWYRNNWILMMRGRKCWHTQYPRGSTSTCCCEILYLTHSVTQCQDHVSLLCQCYCYILGRPCMDNSVNEIPQPPVSANTSNDIFVSFPVLTLATREILSARRTLRLWRPPLPSPGSILHYDTLDWD